VGRYRLEAEVGRGGMGVVYRAVDPALGRPVALKLLAPHLGGDATALARFRREAAAVANLKHPHIALVYEYGEHAGQPFIALEWVEGRTLRAVLDQEKRLPLERALAIFDQLADALDYAHARGVIHRDIKPSNIILDANDGLTLVDFGLARLANADVPAITVGAEFFGTPEYLAPEQFAGLPVDGRTDLYGLALVTYEMLAGQLPFTAHTWPALVQAHLYAAPIPITEVNPALPAAVEAALTKGLAKDPAQRFATAAALGAALRGPSSQPLSHGETRPITRGDARRGEGMASPIPRRWLAALGAFVVVAIAAALLWLRPALGGLGPGGPTPTRPVAQTVEPLPTITQAAPSPTVAPTPLSGAQPATTPSPIAPPQTMTFAPGATAGQASGQLQAGESRSFVLRAFKDQLMQVHLDSPGNDVYLAVAGGPDEPPLLSLSAGQTAWQGLLPATQDYTLTVAAAGQATTFRLRVDVPYRVVFPAGATTVVVSGTFATSDAVSYVLYALQGQTLTATVSVPGGAASLLIATAQDETPLVSSASAAQSAAATLKLPASQDYIIKVVPGGDQLLDFTLEITITSEPAPPTLARDGLLVSHAFIGLFCSNDLSRYYLLYLARPRAAFAKARTSEGAAFAQLRPNATRLDSMPFRLFGAASAPQSDICNGFFGLAASHVPKEESLWTTLG